MIKKILLYSFVLFIIVMTLAGCGSSETDGDNVKNNDSYTLKISSYAPDTLNPILTNNSANASMMNLIFEPLVYVDDSGKPVACLAQSWSYDKDSLKWHINLRQNVRFSDSEPLTAYDVKSSLEAAMNSEPDSVYKNNLSNIEAMNAPDALTLDIQLKTPNVNFINLLCLPICKGNQAQKNADFLPVGTGPYVMQSKTGEVIELVKNDDYWNKKDSNISRIQAVLLPNKNVQSFAFDTNAIDIISGNLALLSKYKGNSESNLMTISTNNLYFLGINNKKLQDKALRQAVNMAVNKKKLCDDIVLSQYKPAESFINSNNALYYPQLPEEVYNPEAAKLLLENSAGSKKNLRLEILVNKDNELKCSCADFIAMNLSDNLGITVKVKKLAFNEYKNLISSGNYQMFIGEIEQQSDFDPSFLLGGGNMFNYSSAEMENRIAEFLSSDEATKNQAYGNIQLLYMDDMPFVSLFFETHAVVISNKILNTGVVFRNNIFYNINQWVFSENTDKKY